MFIDKTAATYQGKALDVLLGPVQWARNNKRKDGRVCTFREQVYSAWTKSDNILMLELPQKGYTAQ